MKVTAVFDIGKTNKKFFLFDKKFREVSKVYQRFDPALDDDGDPCENLPLIEKWARDTLAEAINDPRFQIRSINFSSYGASFVHIGNDGRPITPLYDYLKTCPEDLLQSFYSKYGGRSNFCINTASPSLGFLNSGLQLYWLKYFKPEIFEKIKWSLHLPQYFSYLFTGNPVSEFSSIGSHTSLWDFKKGDYHHWVYQEGIHEKLPPIVAANTTSLHTVYGAKIKIGTGLHDSSSALVPYIRSDRKPFLLVSTGTWSIALNGFSKEHLTDQDLQHDCLSYMRMNGEPVRACRLFLGKEYREQVEFLHVHYNETYGKHRSTKFDIEIYKHLKSNFIYKFKFNHINLRHETPPKTDLTGLGTFSEALHQLTMELVEVQTLCIDRAIGNTKLKKIYIDGGFANNSLYTSILALNFPNYKLRTTHSPLGSALGAALVIDQPELDKKFLKKQYAMKKLTSENH